MYYYPNNGYQAQIQPNMPMQANNLKGRPVSSLEEVRAAQIDFDGSLFIFPDLAHNRIYTKQISLDGNASLNAYELIQLPSNATDNNEYVTQEEFKKAMAQIKEALVANKESVTESPQFNF